MSEQVSGRRKTFEIGLLLCILLLAAGLRFHWLDHQSFWNDEGNSARIAERSLKLILEGAAGDIHPPLYYLALHYWRALVGYSEFALRSFSVMAGVGLVALVYALGARFAGRAAGLAAAFFAAVNPFQVYYSQEARSYIWVAFLAAAASYCAARLFDASSGPAGTRRRLPFGWSVAYALLIAAGLYTHYLFLIALIPINLLALLHLIRDRDAGFLRWWVALHLAAGLLYLPWAPVAFRAVTGWPAAEGGGALGEALLETFRLLSLGLTIETAAARPALLGFGFLLLLGLIPRPAGKRSSLLNYLWPLLWLLLPVVLILAFDLYKPAYLKFMLVTSPAFCLLLGRGLTRFLLPVTRSSSPLVLPVALSLGLVLSFGYDSLDNLYTDPGYARVDYRGMAEHIQSVARPGDAVVLDAANQWEVFTNYYPHVDRVYPLPRSRPVNVPEVTAELEQIAAEHDRIFAIFWAEVESDPQRVVERWLDAHAYKATDDWWGNVRLVTYAVPAAPAVEPTITLDARFGEQIVLRGYALLNDHLAPADILQITLFWEALEPIQQRYKVFLHLLNAEGAVVAQRDSEPGGGLALTTVWEVGQTQVDNHGILIPADVPPGEYRLILGLYPIEDPNARLVVAINAKALEDHLQIALINIAQP